MVAFVKGEKCHCRPEKEVHDSVEQEAPVDVIAGRAHLNYVVYQLIHLDIAAYEELVMQFFDNSKNGLDHISRIVVD